MDRDRETKLTAVLLKVPAKRNVVAVEIPNAELQNAMGRFI